MKAFQADKSKTIKTGFCLVGKAAHCRQNQVLKKLTVKEFD